EVGMAVGPLAILRRYSYEAGQGNAPGQLAALMKLVPVSQVLYGTDFPYRTGLEAVEGLADYGFSEADLSGINRDNAMKLMPGIKGGWGPGLSRNRPGRSGRATMSFIREPVPLSPQA